MSAPADLKMLNILFKAAMATEAKLIAFGKSAVCHPDQYPAVVHAASGWRVFADQLQDAASPPPSPISAETKRIAEIIRDNIAPEDGPLGDLYLDCAAAVIAALSDVEGQGPTSTP